ncbi:MAG: ArsA family ATPase [Candidatus Dadabacteria bacterium]|nr:MAG: ArsA family ATPase [Candidatus Dadabacteria bacterium]
MTLLGLENHRILIVGGSGGVGKTSVSAAIGIASAIEGYRTLVLTIDPARRLANALGLDGIGAEAADVTPRLVESGLAPKGTLHAMMLDVENTLNRVVERYAPDPQTKQRILDNRLYQNISTRLTGSQEYASMQRLSEIAAEGTYDRIILDTPPSTHALDFLTAPQRLMEFFDSKLIQIFVSVGGRAGRGLFRVTDVFFRALERLTGGNVISEIADFFRLTEDVLEPFRTQSDRADALLRDPQTTFIVVTGPNQHQLDDALRFRRKLDELRIAVSAFVVNRWLRPVLGTGPLPTASEDDLLVRLLDWTAKLERVAREQTDAIDRLQQSAGVPVHRVPVFDADIHSIEGLTGIIEALERPGGGA